MYSETFDNFNNVICMLKKVADDGSEATNTYEDLRELYISFQKNNDSINFCKEDIIEIKEQLNKIITYLEECNKKSYSASIRCTCTVIPENPSAMEKLWGILQNYYMRGNLKFIQIKDKIEAIVTPELLEKIIPVINDIIRPTQDEDVIIPIALLLIIIYESMQDKR